MRAMILLAGSRSETNPLIGGNVTGLPFHTLDPLYVCNEYQATVIGMSIPKLPPLGEAFVQRFHHARELNEELANQLMSDLNSALSQISGSQDSDLAAVWSAATLIASDDLAKWIEQNRGQWVTQVWAG